MPRVQRPGVSVVVHGRAPVEGLGELRARLAAQRLDADVELHVLDGTPSDLRTAVATCRHDRVVLLQASALPASPSWLHHLLAPLKDPAVAACASRLLAGPDAGPVARFLAPGRWRASDTAHRVHPGSEAAFQALSPDERRRACALHALGTALRREALERVPLDPDDAPGSLRLWAHAVLRAGLALQWTPAAALLWHADEGPAEALRRARAEERAVRAVVPAARPTLRDLVREVGSEVSTCAKVLVREPPRVHQAPGELARALAAGVAAPLGRWLGGRRA